MRLKNIIGLLSVVATINAYGLTSTGISTPVDVSANLIKALELTANTSNSMATISTTDTMITMSDVILTATGDIGKVVKMSTPSNVTLTGAAGNVTIPVTFDGGTVVISGSDVTTSDVLGTNGQMETTLKIATKNPIVPLAIGTYVGTLNISAVYE